METMNYTGIDQHKRTSTLVTVDTEGHIVHQEKLKNNPAAITAYFRRVGGIATVESTSGWYWLNDLLDGEGIELKLAHAKYLKAISYAKVKTDKVDATTLAQLLRVGMIPEAHKIDRSLRDERDTLRARLRLVVRRTAVLNSIHRVLEKFNVDSKEALPRLYQLQVESHIEHADLLQAQIKRLESELNETLGPNEAVQRLLWIPGIGRINAFTIYLEIGDIRRFPDVKRFHSYCRLVPGAHNSAGKTRSKSSKDGNRYLKIAFSHAVVRAIQYNADIRRYYNGKRRKKCIPIAKAIVAKELARIVYNVLKSGEDYDGKFKGELLERRKARQWPRRAASTA